MNQLKNLRTGKGVSQQIVADYLEITRQAYSNYENGNRAPDNETLLKLAEFFEVTVDYLLRGEEKTPTQEGERQISDSDMMFALWGDSDEMDQADMDEVKRYADYVRERKRKK